MSNSQPKEGLRDFTQGDITTRERKPSGEPRPVRAFKPSGDPIVPPRL